MRHWTILSCIGTIALSGPELRKSKQTYCTCCTFTVNEFWVTVQRTEASERCGLLGNYWLKADGESLILKEPKTKKNLLVWPYKLLRRYGRDRVSSYFIIFNRIWREIKQFDNIPLHHLHLHKVLHRNVYWCPWYVRTHKWCAPEILLWLFSACISGDCYPLTKAGTWGRCCFHLCFLS